MSLAVVNGALMDIFRYNNHITTTATWSDDLYHISDAQNLLKKKNNLIWSYAHTWPLSVCKQQVHVHWLWSMHNLARGYRTFFLLNSAQHEIFSANKYENANNSWHFHIY